MVLNKTNAKKASGEHDENWACQERQVRDIEHSPMSTIPDAALGRYITLMDLSTIKVIDSTKNFNDSKLRNKLFNTYSAHNFKLTM